MKYIILSLLIFSQFTLNAQNSKPSKGQTIDWLKNNIPKKIYESANIERYSSFITGELLIKDFDIKNDSLFIFYINSWKWSWLNGRDLTNQNGQEYESYVFSLKDIEEIGIWRHQSWTVIPTMSEYENVDGKSVFPYYLRFFAVNKEPKILNIAEGKKEYTTVALIPFGNATKDENDAWFNKFKDTQLYKAFEHLRKLCGAPEPIRF